MNDIEEELREGAELRLQVADSYSGPVADGPKSPSYVGTND